MRQSNLKNISGLDFNVHANSSANIYTYDNTNNDVNINSNINNWSGTIAITTIDSNNKHISIKDGKVKIKQLGVCCETLFFYN